MTRPPSYYPIAPIHMAQQRYQQQANLSNPVVAGQTSQVPQVPQTPQVPHLAATTPKVWDVKNHAEAPAYISTHFGRYEKREAIANRIVTPILHSNENAGIKAKATSLRQAYPALIRKIKKPVGWDDLYYLWDAADIQLEGPKFLFYVMHLLGAQNDQLDREFEEARNSEIDECIQAWVTDNRELVLNSAVGSMYGLFCSDSSGHVDFDKDLKPILSKALEAHRLRLLRNNSRHLVHVATPDSLQSNSLPQMLHHQAPNTSRARAVSDRVDRVEQSGERTNRPNMSVATVVQSIPTEASEGNLELNGRGHASAQAQSTSMLHSGRNLSMPLPLTTQNQSKPLNQDENMDLVSALPSQPQTYDHLMQIQRNMTPGVNASPNRSNNYRTDNGFRNKPRPRGNSIETPRNRRNQWTGTASYGPHLNKFMHQPQHNNQPSISDSMRGSPPRAPQSEPIYVRNLQNLQHTCGSSGDTSNQIMANDDWVGSRMDLPNDARNHKTFQHSNISQSLDFGPMEGDPNFQKRNDSCLYRYALHSMPRNAYGRTLYLKGPDLKMFCTHQLKDLMSKVGNVVLIKFLLRAHNNGPVFVT